ncbi:hypothetical protein SCUCBS95973_008306 [Sporothrix curviconia]|uniref:Protein prenyltransferase n=1 Tax=Sporothrix curviconia TaxID=1260050 RepID=A0ABP0CKI3_9PEZI
MSRALDRDTAAALQKGDPEAAFRAIADVLAEEPPLSASSPRPHLEIEFLGRGQSPLPDGEYLLREGNAVAIPKLALVRAFLVARKMLQRYRAVPLSSTDNSQSEAMWRATAVILLMDPEHLTAANTRKRLIQASLRQDLASSPAVSASSLLARELHLVDSLLTSHLHRHTKSPTLWSHRRWLLSFLASPKRVARESNSNDANDRVLQGMTKVVMVAAVRHPRNYYAWEHARWLVHWQQTANGSGDEEGMLHLVVVVRDWCYRNHTDTSGWSFLFFLLASLPLPPSAASLSPLYDETVAQAEQMATSLRWTGEAVWVFLRTAVAYRDCVRGDGKAYSSSSFHDAASALLATVDATSHEHQILQRAQEWCAANAAGRASTTA